MTDLSLTIIKRNHHHRKYKLYMLYVSITDLKSKLKDLF